METLMIILLLVGFVIFIIDLFGGFDGLREEIEFLREANPEDYGLYCVVNAEENGWMLAYVNPKNKSKLGVWMHGDTFQLLSINDDTSLLTFKQKRLSKKFADAILLKTMRELVLPELEEAFNEAIKKYEDEETSR